MTRPGTDELRRLYLDELKTLKEISVPLGVSPALVRKWLLADGIPVRSVSEARKLAKKPKYSEETLERMRQRAAYARSLTTLESRRKQSETRRLKKIEPHNKGRSWTPEERATHMAVRRTDEYRAKLSASLAGEKNPLWRGGRVSRSPSGWRWRQVRDSVYERDNWTCQECGCKCLNTRDSKKHPKRKIQCHHIVSRRNGGGDEPDNLVTLCMSCHHKIERREARTKE